jgi:hypothetical protein
LLAKRCGFCALLGATKLRRWRINDFDDSLDIDEDRRTRIMPCIAADQFQPLFIEHNQDCTGSNVTIL